MVAQYGELTDVLSTIVCRMALVLTQHNLMLSFIDYLLWQTNLNVVCTETDQQTTTTIRSVLWQTDTPPYSVSAAVTHHIHTTTTTTQSAVCTRVRTTPNTVSNVADWYSSFTLYCGKRMRLHKRKRWSNYARTIELPCGDVSSCCKTMAGCCFSNCG